MRVGEIMSRDVVSVSQSMRLLPATNAKTVFAVSHHNALRCLADGSLRISKMVSSLNTSMSMTLKRTLLLSQTPFLTIKRTDLVLSSDAG
jgi:hypothetical protein